MSSWMLDYIYATKQGLDKEAILVKDRRNNSSGAEVGKFVVEKEEDDNDEDDDDLDDQKETSETTLIEDHDTENGQEENVDETDDDIPIPTLKNDRINICFHQTNNPIYPTQHKTIDTELREEIFKCSEMENYALAHGNKNNAETDEEIDDRPLQIKTSEKIEEIFDDFPMPSFVKSFFRGGWG